MLRVRYRGMDDEHVQAKVELGQGRTALVDLGPAPRLSGVDLSQGDSIRILADTVRIGGERALRAEQVRANGEVVDLDRSWERQRYRSGPRTDR